jgi:hypothetical protein
LNNLFIIDKFSIFKNSELHYSSVWDSNGRWDAFHVHHSPPVNARVAWLKQYTFTSPRPQGQFQTIVHVSLAFDSLISGSLG